MTEEEKLKLKANMLQKASIHCMFITILGAILCMWLKSVPLIFVFLAISVVYYEIHLRRFAKIVKKTKEKRQ